MDNIKSLIGKVVGAGLGGGGLAAGAEYSATDSGEVTLLSAIIGVFTAAMVLVQQIMKNNRKAK